MAVDIDSTSRTFVSLLLLMLAQKASIRHKHDGTTLSFLVLVVIICCTMLLFCVRMAHNPSALAGAVFISFGLVCNSSVILANKGKMPVPDCIDTEQKGRQAYIHAQLGHTHLRFLGDAHMIGTKKYVLAFSIGDIMLVLGICIIVGNAVVNLLSS